MHFCCKLLNVANYALFASKIAVTYFFLKKISSLYVLSLAVQGVPAVFACIPSPCYQNLVDM